MNKYILTKAGQAKAKAIKYGKLQQFNHIIEMRRAGLLSNTELLKALRAI